MPIIKSAKKRMRQAEVKRSRNVVFKRELKDAVKAFIAKPTSTTLSKTQSMFDLAVKKNVLKSNTAARRKAKLAAVAKAGGVKLAAKKKTSPPKTASKKTPVKKKAATKAKAPVKKTVAKKTKK